MRTIDRQQITTSNSEWQRMRASKIGIILGFKAKQKAYMVSEEFCSIYCEIC